MKKVILSLLLANGLFAATTIECKQYETKFAEAINKTDSNLVSMKKYSMLMVKSYFDSIILECKGKKNYNNYVRLIPQIKKQWKYNVPSKIRNQPQNQWKY